MITNKQFMMDQFWSDRHIQKFGMSSSALFLMQGKCSLTKESFIDVFDLPESIVRKFAKDKSPYIRAALARKVDDLPLDCAKILVHDDNVEIRHHVAIYSKQADILYELCNDSTYRVKRAAERALKTYGPPLYDLKRHYKPPTVEPLLFILGFFVALCFLKLL